MIRTPKWGSPLLSETPMLDPHKPSTQIALNLETLNPKTYVALNPPKKP